jgi:hypothetical protein
VHFFGFFLCASKEEQHDKEVFTFYTTPTCSGENFAFAIISLEIPLDPQKVGNKNDIINKYQKLFVFIA